MQALTLSLALFFCPSEAQERYTAYNQPDFSGPYRPGPDFEEPFLGPAACGPEEEFCDTNYCFDLDCNNVLIEGSSRGQCRCREGLMRDRRSRRCVPRPPGCDDFPPPFEGDRPFIKEGGERLLYRLYNQLNSDHMLTRHWNDVYEASKTYDYHFEGPIAKIAGTPDDILVPCDELVRLRRLWRSNDHFYTTNEAEAQDAISQGYRDEETVGLCVASEGACGATRPLFRFFNEGLSDHYYTTDYNEDLSDLGGDPGTWNEEGIECFLWPL